MVRRSRLIWGGRRCDWDLPESCIYLVYLGIRQSVESPDQGNMECFPGGLMSSDGPTLKSESLRLLGTNEGFIQPDYLLKISNTGGDEEDPEVQHLSWVQGLTVGQSSGTRTEPKWCWQVGGVIGQEYPGGI